MSIKFVYLVASIILIAKNIEISFAVDSAQKSVDMTSSLFTISSETTLEKQGETLSSLTSPPQEMVPFHTDSEIFEPNFELTEKKRMAWIFLESLSGLEQIDGDLKYLNYFDENCTGNIASSGFQWCYAYTDGDGLQKLSFMKRCAQFHFDSFWRGLLTLNWVVNLQLSFTLNNYVPDSIDHFSQLTSLDLSSNQLTSLPSRIRNLRKLTSLNLSYNKFEFFPDSIFDLLNLENLDLYENKVKTVPSIIKSLKNIRSFDLRKNPLLLSSSENMQAEPLCGSSILYRRAYYLGNPDPSSFIYTLKEWGFSELRDHFGSSRVFHLSL